MLAKQTWAFKAPYKACINWSQIFLNIPPLPVIPQWTPFDWVWWDHFCCVNINLMATAWEEFMMTASDVDGLCITNLVSNRAASSLFADFTVKCASVCMVILRAVAHRALHALQLQGPSEEKSKKNYALWIRGSFHLTPSPSMYINNCLFRSIFISSRDF